MAVLTFRLDPYDSAGNRGAPAGVELRALSISGKINEGEEVEVAGRWRGGTLRADRIVNLSTGAEIRGETVRTLASEFARAHRVAVVVAVVALLLLVTVILTTVSVFGGGNDRRTVPRVEGLVTFNARSALLDAGFRLSSIDVRGNEFCRVLRQDPEPGTSVGDDTRVTLFTGPSGTDDPLGCR